MTKTHQLQFTIIKKQTRPIELSYRHLWSVLLADKTGILEDSLDLARTTVQSQSYCKFCSCLLM